MFAVSVLLSNSALFSAFPEFFPASGQSSSGSGDWEAFQGAKSDPFSSLSRLTSDSSLNKKENKTRFD
jgi:hypothetical protein